MTASWNDEADRRSQDVQRVLIIAPLLNVVQNASRMSLNACSIVKTVLPSKQLKIICWLLGLVVLPFGMATIVKAQDANDVASQQIIAIAPAVVVSVQFDGNHHLSDAELATMTKTRVPSLFTRAVYYIPFIGSALGASYDSMNFANLQLDTARLVQYYQDHGFLLAKASYEVRASKKDIIDYESYLRARATYRLPPAEDISPILHDTVIFHIEEGPAFTISHITFSGLENLPEELLPALTEHVSIKSGDRWSVESAGREVNRLDSIMMENGYPYFRHDTTVVQVTMGTTDVNVSFYYTTGPRLKFGNVEIRYDTNSAEKLQITSDVIKAQLVTDSGAWYRQSLVLQSERNLNVLNNFNIVRVALDADSLNALPAGAQNGAAIPVLVSLRLRLRAGIAPGLYAGSGSQGFVFGASVGYQNRNLHGRADNVDLQVNYQFLPTTQKRYNSSVDYTVPYLGWGRAPITFGVAASHQEQLQDSLLGIKQYYTTTFATHLGSQFLLSEFDNRSSVKPDVTFQYTFTTAADSAINAILPQKQLSLIPSTTYVRDQTNDVFNPSTGYLLSISGEVGVPLPGPIQSSNYWRLAPLFKEYFSVKDNAASVFATRLQIGYTQLFDPSVSESGPPIDRRYYGGGATSVRGWAERSLLVSRDSNAGADLGGISTLLFSAEWRYAPFQFDHNWTTWQQWSSPIRLVLFYDIGNVWDQSVNPITSAALTQLAQTVGIGLRYNTLFGPLRVDWGFKLYDPTGNFDHTRFRPVLPTDHGRWLWQLPSGWEKFLKMSADIMTIQFAIGQAF